MAVGWMVLLEPAALWAQKNVVSQNRIYITADAMTSEREKSFVEFTGNAMAQSQDAVIHADAIKVFLYTVDEKKQLSKTDEQNIKEIIAEGNVKFTSNDQNAFADKAVYTTLTQKLILTGDAPKVTTGESYVTGKKITLFRKNGKVVVESGKKKRVEALFNSTNSTKKKEGE